MPLPEVRDCNRCPMVRYAACSVGCGIGAENVPESWRPNLTTEPEPELAAVNE